MNTELQRSCDLQDHSKNHFQSYLPKAANIFQRSCKASSSKSFIMPGLIRLNSVGEDSSVSHVPKIDVNPTVFRKFTPLQFTPSSLKKSLTSPIMNSSAFAERFNLNRCWQNKNLAKPIDMPPNYNFNKYHVKGLGMHNSSFMDKNNFHSFSSPDFKSDGMEFYQIAQPLFQPDKIIDSLEKIYTPSLCQPIVKNCALPSCLVEDQAQSYVNLLTSNSNNESPSKENSSDCSEVSVSVCDTEKCQDSSEVAHDSLNFYDSDQSITDTSSDLSASQEDKKPAQSVLLTPRKVVKKGRPSSKKRKKRQRQKQNHLLNSSDHPVSESKNSNCIKKSVCKESTPVKSESKSCKLPCVLFTLQSDSDQSDSEDSSDWSLCNASISPIKDCAFNVALSMDAIFKQTHIPSLESVFTTAGESSSDSEISFLSPSDCDIETDSCEQLVNDTEMKEINAKWERCYPSAGFRSCKSVTKEKIENPSIKVHFAADPDLLTVYLVGTEDRCGDWHHYALDRDRFERRIQEASQILSPILEQQHRVKIMERNTHMISCTL